MGSNSSSEESPVSLTLPPFPRESDPEFWFLQAEAMFEISGIHKDKKKFNHLVASLGAEFAEDLTDMIRNPPTENMYDTLKKRLISIFVKSQEKNMLAVLRDIQLGEDCPSHMLYKMKEAVGENAKREDVLKTMWLKKLPFHVQDILEAGPENL